MKSLLSEPFSLDGAQWHAASFVGTACQIANYWMGLVAQ